MAGTTPAFTLAHADDLGWKLDIPTAIDPRGSGILEWRIEGYGSAIVRASVIVRTIQQYEESVWRLRQGLPHRVGRGAKSVVDGAIGADAGAAVTVIALENCDVADLAARKRHWIAIRGTRAGAG